MERYLAAPVADSDEDVLQWWSRHADIYPALARLARAYLAIPATSAAAERLFSRGERQVTKRRGRLGGKTIQALACLSDVV